MSLIFFFENFCKYLFSTNNKKYSYGSNPEELAVLVVEFIIETRLPFLIVHVVAVFLQFHRIQFLCKFLHGDKPDGRMQQMNKIHSFAIQPRLLRFRLKRFQITMSYSKNKKFRKSADSRALLLLFIGRQICLFL